jgi:hypothetical protein
LKPDALSDIEKEIQEAAREKVKNIFSSTE